MDVIHLYGAILPEDEKDSYSVSLHDIEAQLAKCKGHDVDVLIDSVGGDVDEGFAIYDLLKASGKNIHTTIVNKCYSIATVVLCAAPIKNRRSRANGQTMIHNPWIQPNTPMEARDLVNAAIQMKETENKLAKFYESETGVPAAIFAKLMSKTSYLKLDEAKEVNLIGEVLEPVKAYAMSKEIINFKKENTMDEKSFLDKAVTALTSAFTKKEDAPKAEEAPKAMEFTDVEGKTLTVEKESGDIMVGDKASPDGVYTMDGGEVVTVEGEVITSIVVPDAEPSEEMKELQSQLEASNAKVAELEKAMAEKDTAIKAFEEDKAKKAEQTSTKFKPSARAQNFKQDRATETLEERRARRKAEQNNNK